MYTQHGVVRLYVTETWLSVAWWSRRRTVHVRTTCMPTIPMTTTDHPQSWRRPILPCSFRLSLCETVGFRENEESSSSQRGRRPYDEADIDWIVVAELSTQPRLRTMPRLSSRLVLKAVVAVWPWSWWASGLRHSVVPTLQGSIPSRTCIIVSNYSPISFFHATSSQPTVTVWSNGVLLQRSYRRKQNFIKWFYGFLT